MTEVRTDTHCGRLLAVLADGRSHTTRDLYRRAGNMPHHTRTYLVFRQTSEGTLSLVGETDATNNASAVEALGNGEGVYSSVAKGSLMSFVVEPRLVARRQEQP